MLKDFAEEKFDIFIQAGQSNSEGYGFGDVDAPYEPSNLVWYMNGDFTISRAEEKVVGNGIQTTFALAFAQEYLRHGLLKEGRKLLILRSAVGGTGFLDNRWKMTDDLYLRMMEMIRTALFLNKENQLMGLLWHQGETDALLNAGYEQHYSHLMGLLRSVRTEFHVPRLPFIAGDFVQHWKNDNLAICKPVIMAIRDVCRDCGYGSFVDTDGLKSNMQEGAWDYAIGEDNDKDTIHFSRKSCYLLGRRYFEAFLKITENVPRSMTKRERVWNALNHRPVDKIPKGEIAISPGIANRILGGGYSEAFMDYEREKAVRELLKMDFVNVGDWPSWQIGTTEKGDPIFQSNYGEKYIDNGVSKHIIERPFADIEESDSYRTPDIKKVSGDLVRKFAEETDFFVFAQIGGPISMVNELVGMEDYMVWSMTNTEKIRELARKIMIYEVQKAKLFIDSGADGILLADDMAFNTGVFLPPYIMEEVAYPFYEEAIREIKAHKNVPIVLHTDGNINTVLDRIVKLGFDGIQSLQPFAGMDIREVKEKYGDKICLIGNIDLDYIMTFAPEEEVRKNVQETIRSAAKGSGFILSTCNTLVDIIPLENVHAMYEAAENFDMEELNYE